MLTARRSSRTEACSDGSLVRFVRGLERRHLQLVRTGVVLKLVRLDGCGMGMGVGLGAITAVLCGGSSRPQAISLHPTARALAPLGFHLYFVLAVFFTFCSPVEAILVQLSTRLCCPPHHVSFPFPLFARPRCQGPRASPSAACAVRGRTPTRQVVWMCGSRRSRLETTWLSIMSARARHLW